VGRELIEQAVREALEAAPDDEHRRHWQRIADVIAQGRTIRTKTFSVVVSTTDPLDPELVAAIEEVFAP
jgi:hypothetical protein